ncbi:MAG: hypothetical protein H7Y04_01905 [Verrucomicrobia bacterium]|nr:hypothetical protein [Cytophagales bacterium]
MYILSDEARVGQTILLVVSIPLVVGSCIIILGTEEITLYSVFFLLVYTSVFFYVNFSASKGYDVYVGNKKIYLKNLYRKTKVYEANEFEKITCKFDTYYRIHFTNGEKFVFSKHSFDILITYFKSGEQGIIKKLEKEIQEALE